MIYYPGKGFKYVTIMNLRITLNKIKYLLYPNYFSEEDITFLYPDMKTVLIGKFRNGVMIQAKASRITSERCHNGIKEIKVAKPKMN